MHHRARLGSTLALVGAIAGCKSDRIPVAEAQKTGPATVTVTAHDYSFDAPDRITAGVTRVHLVNNGKELHHAQLIRIEEGKTMEDVARALKTSGPPPSWVRFVGGPNAVAPGQETHATSVLAPGRYAYLCFIPSGDRVIHAVKGMVRPFEVTAGSSTAAELPPSDVTIKMVDYDYHLSKPLTRGRHTITVENDGPQPHELALLRLAPGKTVADFVAWDEGGMKGPPPAEPIGGVVVLDKGGRASFTADLTAGDYGLLCFVPDGKDGKLHLVHGMMKTIKVS
jgi:plastocyanin